MLPSPSSQHHHHRRRWRHWCSHLLCSKTTKKGEGSYRHHFFCNKVIEEGDGSCLLLLICYNRTTKVLKHKEESCCRRFLRCNKIKEKEGNDNNCRRLLCCNKKEEEWNNDFVATKEKTRRWCQLWCCRLLCYNKRKSKKATVMSPSSQHQNQSRRWWQQLSSHN